MCLLQVSLVPLIFERLITMKREKLLDAWKKYKSAILYLIFGGLTTLINIVSYSLLYYLAELSNSISNVLAWVFSVLFAFITNKLFVFENKSFALTAFLFEIGSFFLCRLATGVLDLGIMYLFVDVLKYNALLMKILSNIIVIILNYFASKFFVFKKKEKEDEST